MTPHAPAQYYRVALPLDFPTLPSQARSVVVKAPSARLALRVAQIKLDYRGKADNLRVIAVSERSS